MINPEILFVAKYSVPGVNNASIRDCVDYINVLQKLGVDIETTRKYPLGTFTNEDIYRPGLDPYLSKVVMFQIGDLKRIFVIDTRCYTKEELQPIFDQLHYTDEKLIVGVNLRFEAKHLGHNYGLKFKRIYDAMIADMVLWNGIPKKFGLADMAERYLGVKKKKENILFEEMYEKAVITLDDDLLKKNEEYITPFEVANDAEIDKSTRLQFLTIGDKPFTIEQILYGADDIVYPLLIMERQQLGRKISEKDIYYPDFCIRLENSFVNVLADIELNGMKVDVPMWNALAGKKEEEYGKRMKELNSYVTTLYPHWGYNDLFHPDEPECLVQWSSSKQTIKFFKELNLCPKGYSKQTGRIEDTTGAKEMTKQLKPAYKILYDKGIWEEFDKDENGKYIEDNQKLVLAFLNLKKLEQCYTTFGKEWTKKYIHPITKRVHTSYRQILNTGRISSTAPNLQQIPGDKDYRHCFSVEEDEWMINNDYSAQESRDVAIVSEDESFINFFLKGDPVFGDDFHSFTGTKIKALMTGDPNAIVQPKELPDGSKNPKFTADDDERRGKSKVFNFGFVYGKSAAGFAEDFGCTVEEAQAMIDSYLQAFPGLNDYFEQGMKFVTTYGFIIIDPTTGRRWFSNEFDKYKSLYEEGMEVYKTNEDYLKLTTKAEKEAWKKEFKEENPWFRQIWREWSTIKGSLERRSKNFRIQGLAGSQMKLAMNLLRHRIISENLDMQMVNIIHDESLSVCKKVNGEEYGKIVQKCMEDGGNFFCKYKIMKASYQLENYWTH